MSSATFILVLVTLQRLSELVIARTNTARLVAMGGVEHGASHYPVMVLLHASWLGGLWWFGWNASVNLYWLIAYAALQVFRVWILISLGKRWTTRIITVPGETLVKRGPYRFLSHPNYALVACEIPVLPMVFGQPTFAFAYFLLNSAMLWWRIRIESEALRNNSGLRYIASRNGDASS
jgi:methyltransferase